jgi:pimeloyl-ACP methyl ester carboxylesterase
MAEGQPQTRTTPEPRSILLSWRQWPWFRALGQTQTEVTTRSPGERFLSSPISVRPYATEDWEFAWLAASAYGKTPAAAKRRARTTDTEEHVDPEGPLRVARWERWKTFPSDGLHRKIEQTHLRVEVWQKCREDGTLVVVVTFGGTVFNNEMDWRANLRWFFPGRHRDQYTDVVRTFAPAFVDEFVNRLGDCAAQPVELISTGHSLGGGLAQQFAYAHCVDEKVPRVTKVYAFDPSPVTGFYSVKRSVRDVNRTSLKIDRIYERGEILAIVRSITSVLWKPSKTAPQIRGRRYFLFSTWNPITGHSMIRMAVRMSEAAGHPPSESLMSPQTPPDGPLAKSHVKFYLAEYGRVRQEVVWLLKDYRALERNVVIAVAVSWAWLFETDPPRPKLAWFLPVLFVGLGVLRASGIFKQFGVFHRYLMSMEASFSKAKDPRGWEHFSWQKTGWVSTSAILFWLVLASCAVVVAYYEYSHVEPAPAPLTVPSTFKH